MINASSLLRIFKASPVPTVILLPDDPEFTVVEVNDYFLRETKKTADEIVGQGIFKSFPGLETKPACDSDLRSSLKKVMETSSPYKAVIDDIEVTQTIPIVSDSGQIECIVHSYLNDVATNVFCIDKKCFKEKLDLKESAGRYKKLFHLSPVPKVVVDPDVFSIADVNDIAIQKYGYSRQEFLELKAEALVAEDELTKFVEACEDVKTKDGRVYLGVFSQLKKDKTKINVELSANRFVYNGKNCILITCIDITAKKEALSNLEENQQRLLAAENIGRIGYWKLDLKTGDLYWSDKIFNILGLNKAGHKVTYQSFFSKLHPEDKEVFSAQRQLALEGKKNLDMEFRIVKDDGGIKWVLEKGKMVKNAFGEPISFEGTIQDITESKLLKLSLEESNQRYDYVTKATFDAIWDWDLVSDNSYWGEGFERTFGYDLSLINADRNFWSRHIHPDDFDKVVNGIQKSILGSDTNWSYEYRFEKADGNYAFVMDRCIIIRDKNGKAIRLVGAMQDISEKKTLQQLLDKANRLAKIGSWEIDVPSATVYWSDITKEIRETGPDYEPTLEDGIGHFKEGFSRDTIIARVKESIRFGTSWQEDLQIFTHKGNLKWIRTTGKAELKDGKCLKIFGSFQDIDESKKAELEIIKLYEEKNAILESIGDGFFTVDQKWIITYWNDAAEKLLDMKKDEVLGKNLWLVFSKSLHSHSYKKYHEAIETKQRIFFEDYYESLDRWFEISAYPSKNGLSVYFKDITDRIVAKMELNELNLHLEKIAHDLKASNSELEQFAYIASHDLQEPLRMVTSFLAQIEKKYNDVLDEKGKQYIHFAVDGAKRMRQIILDLLSFSRVGSFEGEPESINLNEVIEEIVYLFQEKIEETSATIQFDKLPFIFSFRSPIRQLIQNLIGNAIKYHRAGIKPEILVQAEELPAHWKIMIKDNGIGIEPEYYDRIFNIFQRLHNKEEYSGTGIGLAIAKKIVTALGGQIWIEQNGESGSVFNFTIPK